MLNIIKNKSYGVICSFHIFWYIVSGDFDEYLHLTLQCNDHILDSCIFRRRHLYILLAQNCLKDVMSSINHIYKILNSAQIYSNSSGLRCPYIELTFFFLSRARMRAESFYGSDNSWQRMSPSKGLPWHLTCDIYFLYIFFYWFYYPPSSRDSVFLVCVIFLKYFLDLAHSKIGLIL